MVALSIQVPYPVFYDREGQPLDNGNIYIGVANLDPITNPIQVYYDDALTITASQPLKTSNGYIYRNGTPAQLYVNAGNFSITVNDSKNLFVYNFPEGAGITSNASSVEYDPPFIGSVPTNVEAKLAQYISAKDFGAVGNGIANDTAALQAWLNAHAAAQAAQSNQAPSPNIINFTGAVAELPAGIYVSDNLTYNGSSLRLTSQSGGMIKFNDGCGLTATNVSTLDIYGITFVGGGTSLLVKNNNLDGALFVVDRCRFMNQTDWPINFEPTTPNSGYNTNHLSGLAVIRDCVWYNTNGCARTYFDKTLIDGGYATVFRAADSANARLQANRAAFECRSLGDGIELRGFFGTPITNAGGDGNVWVDNYPGFNGAQDAPDTPTPGYVGGTAVVSYGGGVFAHDCRFGAEEGGMPIIRNWCHALGSISQNGNVHLSVQNCGLMAPGNGGPLDKRGVIVLKKGVPSSIRIVGGSGPLGAAYINATAMLDLDGAPASLAYWLGPLRKAQNTYSVDIEGYNAGAYGNIPAEFGSASVIEGSNSGLTRQKIFPQIGLRGNMRLFNNQSAIIFESEAFGGAVRLRSNGAAATDRGVQLGRVDNAGAYTGFWEVDADSGTFAPVGDFANDIGSDTKRVGTVYSRNVKMVGVAVGALPAAGTIGAGGRAFVNDATATTFASVVAGGGANSVPVYSDGTNWLIG